MNPPCTGRLTPWPCAFPRWVAFAILSAWAVAAWAEDGRIIEDVKGSVVAVGTFERTRSPAFRFLGTGFAVADGSLIATNSHVVPETLNHDRNETLVIAVSAPEGKIRAREARTVAVDPQHDLALLKIDGPPLRPLPVTSSDHAREGDTYLFTGFPLGSVLGLVPVTHRAMISAVTPIAIPGARDRALNSRLIRQLKTGPFRVYQLDATAYPGNSGSPLYNPQTGEVAGVVNMVFVKAAKEAAIAQPSGITYAIPAKALHELIERSR